MKSANVLLFALMLSFTLLAGCTTTIINEAPDEGALPDNAIETEVDVVEEDVEATDEEDATNEDVEATDEEEAVEDEESEASDVSLKFVDDLKLSEKSDIKVGSFDLKIEEEEDSIPKY